MGSNIITVFVVISGFVSSALADSCSPFDGKWKTCPFMFVTPIYEGIKIKYSDTTSTLSLTLDPDNPEFKHTEKYIVDGQTHQGGGTETYTASCDNENIMIVFDYYSSHGQVVKEATISYTLNGKALNFFETVKGSSRSNKERYVRESNYNIENCYNP